MAKFFPYKVVLQVTAIQHLLVITQMLAILQLQMDNNLAEDILQFDNNIQYQQSDIEMMSILGVSID